MKKIETPELLSCDWAVRGRFNFTIMFEEDGELIMNMKNILAVPLVCAGLSMSSVTWAGDFPDAGVDDVPSLGKFTIILDWSVKKQLEDGFGIKLPSRKFVSPTLSDAHTLIGRSGAHTNGSDSDVNGATIAGTDDATVKDDDFSVVPAEHADPVPDDTREVHTQIISFNLTDNGTANAVRAGADALEQPRSIGEVKSLTEDGDDFPANSFFNVFVEVDVDINEDNIIDITLYNTQPLLIQGELEGFPPNVLYVHGGTENRVVMYDKATNERKGVLKLAGHGVGEEYVSDIAGFEKAYALSVTLDSFTATASNGAVALEWATGTEKDNAGFVVWRAQPLDGQCSNDPSNYTDVQPITSLVASEGTEVSGATYTTTDSNVVSGTTYCYALEDRDFGGKSTYHLDDFVSATP